MSLLAPHEPPCWALENANGAGLGLVCADHASARTPEALGTLGLEPWVFEQHVAYDIGALAVSRLVAKHLDVALLHHGYSRLALDPNRYLTDASSIPATSDAIPVPGNQGLSDTDRQARHTGLFEPYQTKLGDLLIARDTPSLPCPLIAIHSFTPALRDGGPDRPWHFGVLYDEDRRFALDLHAALVPRSDAPVGDNLPYSAKEPKVYTTDHHCERVGRPYVAIEVRQDLIADKVGQEAYGMVLAQALKAVLDQRSYSWRKPHEKGAPLCPTPQTLIA